jgi:hypothetical protein
MDRHAEYARFAGRHGDLPYDSPSTIDSRLVSSGLAFANAPNVVPFHHLKTAPHGSCLAIRHQAVLQTAQVAYRDILAYPSLRM